MILDEIADYAKVRVKEDKEKISFQQMKEKAWLMNKGNFIFEETLKKEKPAIISEVKKASPSKGVISIDFPYLEIAKEYERIGASCISILTEPKWFLGSDEIFREIRQTVKLPLLRKDFTIDEYQIYQGKVMGADAILLIAALLTTNQLKEYIEICDELGISALVETHNEEEIESALAADARIIGVNNRNLKDFSVNLAQGKELRDYIPKDKIFVAESGILTIEDGISYVDSGADALLIGEALMKSQDRANFIQKIKAGMI